VLVAGFVIAEGFSDCWLFHSHFIAFPGYRSHVDYGAA
jgi:hypothetical protein